jgi:tRNA pseudouridine13 synthase
MIDLAAWTTRPPLVTADLPGIGGLVKVHPEDFEVEEIPAYEPSGQGGFLYLWIEKRDLGADYFVRQLARRLKVPVGEIGTAGLKDRRAVTRQWVSVPATCEARLSVVETEGVRLLRWSRHGNKLRPGHLRGNRFRIRLREVDSDAATKLPVLLDRLRSTGMANFYGPQRFGRDGETLALGLGLLHRQSNKRLSPFLKKLALSAVQSALFNAYLARRMNDGLLRTVLDGDVMAKWPVGGLFVAVDLPHEQQRFEARETVHAGPIFGRKTFAARSVALEREQALLADAALPPDAFEGFGKLVQGTRRHNLVYVDDLTALWESGDVVLDFSLPAGSYATLLIRELAHGENFLDESTE